MQRGGATNLQIVREPLVAQTLNGWTIKMRMFMQVVSLRDLLQKEIIRFQISGFALHFLVYA